MQAVILVAGKSTRTYPLTLTRPKPLLPVANRTILDYILTELRGVVNEVILIVGYRKEMIQQRYGTSWQDLKITYCEQKEQLGTGHAILQAEALIEDRFIALNGDDIYDGRDIKKLLPYKYAALARHEQNPSLFGVYQVDEQNRVINLVEKPTQFISHLTNIGCYMFNRVIFNILKETPRSERGEIEITSAILSLAKKEPFYVQLIEGFWLSNGFPWELLNTQNFFLRQQTQSEIKGVVEDHVCLKGIVSIGQNTLVKSGVYIEGPVTIGKNCTIGPNCYIRGCTSIGDNCRIGQSVEIKNSIIMDRTCISHLSYIGDSVIGENVNVGAGFITANLRHDGNNVMSMVKGKLIDTGMKKLGTIIGDDVKTGVNTTVYPGRKIWPGKQTLIGEIIKYDLVD